MKEMNYIHTWSQGSVTIDFDQSVYSRLLNHYVNFSDFLEKLQDFNAELAQNRGLYNISSYPDHVNKGIYVLGKDNSDMGIFSSPHLAIKCSQGNPWAEDLRKQFYKSIRLSQEFSQRLNPKEKSLLQICPVYLHFQTRQPSAFFKQIIFMQNIQPGLALGQTKSGFSQEFCQIFKIPTIEEIAKIPRLKLHLCIDKNKHRQYLKIQAVYLFKRLLKKGIKICSLNQKNILVDTNHATGQTKYIIIDPTEDLFPPITPVYNALTSQFCD